MITVYKALRFILIFNLLWLLATGRLLANPMLKKITVDGYEREYLVYLPQNTEQEKINGMLVCLHGFGRSMDDFFETYNISSVADSLNMMIVAPQALPEQNQRVNQLATTISSLTDNQISLHSVWGCGLRIKANLLLLGTNILNEELNKDVDDVNFIDRMIDRVLSDNSIPAENLFVLGTSMGGFMTYQYALKKGKRLAGIISIAGSMGLDIKGMEMGIKIPVCDFHSLTDEVVPYNGYFIQYLSVISLALPKAEVISYWTKLNATGTPVTEQIKYYPSTNGITVEKITYPDPDYEVIHYKITGASHSYFFKKEAGDCMDHVEEIKRFIQKHSIQTTANAPLFAKQKPVFYPNPVIDRVFLSVTDGFVTMYDLTGRKILSQPFINGQADLSYLKAGVYMIEILSGAVSYTAILLKK